MSVRLDNVVTNDGDLRVCKKVIDRFSALAHRFHEITIVISAAAALLETSTVLSCYLGKCKKCPHDHNRKIFQIHYHKGKYMERLTSGTFRPLECKIYSNPQFLIGTF